jgi:YD repeat-containing protein
MQGLQGLRHSASEPLRMRKDRPVVRYVFAVMRTSIAVVAVLIFLAAALIWSPRAEAGVQYAYDAAGRLVQVVAPDGSSVINQYDAAGNILSVQSIAVGQLALAGLNTTSGGSGSQVVIQGSGFSATPSADAVTFNGIAAVVISATANQIVVQVPAGSASGVVSVTVNGHTTTSVQGFTVLPPTTISGFSPVMVNTGATVTLTGTNLNPTSGATWVSVGGSDVHLISISANQITFTAQASGKILVTTSYSQVSSATDLLVLPTSIPLASVAASALLVGNGAAQSLSIGAQNNCAVYSFDATQGQYLSVEVNSFSTTPSGASIPYSVYSPSEVLIASGSISASSLSIDLPQIAVTGAYFIAFAPGAATAQLNTRLQIAQSLVNGSTLSVPATVSAQTLRYLFSATAGQTLALNANTIVTTPVGQTVGLTVYNSIGTTIGSASGTANATVNLPNLSSGKYVVLVTVSSSASATMQLTLANGIAPTLPVTGTTGNYASTVPGQNAYFYFAGTVGENVGFGLTGLTLSPVSPTYVLVYLYGPTGAMVTYTYCYTSNPNGDCQINALNLPSSGTYSVQVLPMGPQTMSFGFTASKNLTGTLALNTPKSITLVPGEDTSLSFTATAEQTVAVSANTIVTSPLGQSVTLTVYNATGTSVGSGSGTGGVVINLPNLAAGAYTVVMVPSYGASATAQVTLAAGIAPTLPLTGTTGNYASTVPGQNAYFYFAGTAGENVGFGITGLTLSPASPTYVLVYLYGPTGAMITYTYCYTSNPNGDCQINALNLATTGTYSVQVLPMGPQTMTFGFTASKDLTGTLALNTPQSVTLVPGEDTSLSFIATAGQTVAVSANTIVTTPAGQSVTVTVYNSSGTSVGSGSGTASVVVNLPNLAAGTYSVVMVPSYGASATAQVTLAAGIAPTLPVTGTTANYTSTVPGQNAYFYFAGTAGENVGFGLTGLTLSPVSPTYVLVYLYGPTGAMVTYTYCYTSNPNGDCQINALNLPSSGTYSVQVLPMGPQTMSFGFTASKNLTGTLALNTPKSITLVPGEDTSLSFTATAEQTVAVSANTIVTSPLGQSVTLTVYNATGTSVGSGSGTGGVVINLPNLAAGAYTVVMVPSYGASATAQVTLAAGIAPTLPLTGTTGNYASTVPGQNAYFYFAGTAGENVGFGITGLTLSPASPTYVLVYLYGPTGAMITYTYCYTSNPNGDCQINALNLATTGTYSVQVLPMGPQTMTFGFTASKDLTGTLALNTPQSVTLVPGEDTSLSFIATAGQTVAVSANTIVTTPAGQSVTVTVYNSSGTSVGSGSGTASVVVNLPNLAAGTYSVVMVPSYGASATAQVTLAAGIAPTLPVTGTTANYTSTVPGQNAYFYFAGTAGENVGFGLTGLTLSPVSPTYVLVYLYGPTGAMITYTYCYTSNPNGDCQINALNLATTGTYSVQVLPMGPQTMTFGFTASTDLTGSLVLNTPQSVTLVPGEDTALNFTATAGQTVAVSANSIVTTPAAQAVTLTVYNSSHTSVGSVSGTGSVTLNLASLAAGTYSVVIVPSYGASATMQVMF